MKKLTFFIPFILLAITLQGQNIPLNLTGTTEKKITLMPINVSLEPGSPILIKGITRGLFSLPYAYSVKSENNAGYIAHPDLSRISINPGTDLESVWQRLEIFSDSYRKFLSTGIDYKSRKMATDRSNEIISDLENGYGFLRDDYLEGILRTMVHKIHPPTLPDLRPGILSTKILKYNEPFILATPHGTIIISTGLISALRTEEELMSFLAMEAAHFVLDHNFQNLNSGTYLQNMASIAGNIPFSGIIQKAGAAYSKEQMEEAENAALRLMEFNNCSSGSFPTAIKRIRDYYEVIRVSTTFAPVRSYFSLKSANSNTTTEPEASVAMRRYDASFSYLNTLNGGTELSFNRYGLAIDLVDRNIEAGVATEDDYLIKIMAREALSVNRDESLESLELVKKAKSLGILPNNYLNKQEALLLLRLGRNREASQALVNYLENLTNGGDSSSFITEEIQWTQRMLGKIDKLED